MKKLYEKPDAEYIEFIIHDYLMGALGGASDGYGDEDDEGMDV